MKRTRKSNVAEMIVTIVSAILLLWIGASFIDVLCHNDIETGTHVYQAWNAFELFINAFN